MSETKTRTVTIDGVNYNLNDLSDEAKSQLASMRFTELEVQRLQRQLAVAQTARAAYARAVQASLPKPAVAS